MMRFKATFLPCCTITYTRVLAAYARHFHLDKLTQVVNSTRGIFLNFAGVGLIGFFIHLTTFSNSYAENNTLKIVYYIFNHTLYAADIGIVILVIPALVNVTLTMPQQYPGTMSEILLYAFMIRSVLSVAIVSLMYVLLKNQS